MATMFNVEPSKTYATLTNVERAIAKVPHLASNPALRWFPMQDAAGRWFPVFVGKAAVEAGVHFHFNVVG